MVVIKRQHRNQLECTLVEHVLAWQTQQSSSSAAVPHGVGDGADLGSMALQAAPSGLRVVQRAGWAPPPRLKSCLLLRCMGRTGLSIMLPCRGCMCLHHTHAHAHLTTWTAMYDAHVGSLQLQHITGQWQLSLSMHTYMQQEHLVVKRTFQVWQQPRSSYEVLSHQAREVPSSQMLILDAHDARSPSTE